MRGVALMIFMIIVMTFVCSTQGVSIDDFGAVAEINSTEATEANRQALQKAFQHVMQPGQTDKTVVVPEGKNYYFWAVSATDLVGVTLDIQGQLIANDDLDAYPQNSKQYLDFFYLYNCTDLTIKGSYDPKGPVTQKPNVDGKGFEWWLFAVLVLLPNHRPHMFNIQRCNGLTIHNLYLKDSPMYHINARDIINSEMYNIKIRVDTDEQRTLLKKHGIWFDREELQHMDMFDIQKRVSELSSGPVPKIWALNTDGIDPAGKNVYIHDIDIENYDDVVAVKPCNGGHHYATCSENMLIERATIKYGVGLTIGSVPPHVKTNCVKDIYFRDAVFDQPLKGVYIKSNPGDIGDGIIKNITYENLVMQGAWWWQVYIGPQQQGGPNVNASADCSFFYPLSGNCPTNPRITMADFTLKNVKGYDAIFPPGVIHCNASNPCTNIQFEDVNFHGETQLLGYHTDHAHGKAVNSNPDPGLEPSRNARRKKFS